MGKGNKQAKQQVIDLPDLKFQEFLNFLKLQYRIKSEEDRMMNEAEVPFPGQPCRPQEVETCDDESDYHLSYGSSNVGRARFSNYGKRR